MDRLQEQKKPVKVTREIFLESLQQYLAKLMTDCQKQIWDGIYSSYYSTGPSHGFTFPTDEKHRICVNDLFKDGQYLRDSNGRLDLSGIDLSNISSISFNWTRYRPRKNGLPDHSIEKKVFLLNALDWSFINLNGVSFAGSKLHRNTFEICAINNANFVRSSLQQCVINKCDIANPNFEEAELVEMNSFTRITNSSLVNANLKNSRVHIKLFSEQSHVNVTGANLEGMALFAWNGSMHWNLIVDCSQKDAFSFNLEALLAPICDVLNTTKNASKIKGLSDVWKNKLLSSQALPISYQNPIAYRLKSNVAEYEPKLIAVNQTSGKHFYEHFSLAQTATQIIINGDGNITLPDLEWLLRKLKSVELGQIRSFTITNCYLRIEEVKFICQELFMQMPNIDQLNFTNSKLNYGALNILVKHLMTKQQSISLTLDSVFTHSAQDEVCQSLSEVLISGKLHSLSLQNSEIDDEHFKVLFSAIPWVAKKAFTLYLQGNSITQEGFAEYRRFLQQKQEKWSAKTPVVNLNGNPIILPSESVLSRWFWSFETGVSRDSEFLQFTKQQIEILYTSWYRVFKYYIPKSGYAALTQAVQASSLDPDFLKLSSDLCKALALKPAKTNYRKVDIINFRAYFAYLPDGFISLVSDQAREQQKAVLIEHMKAHQCKNAEESLLHIAMNYKNKLENSCSGNQVASLVIALMGLEYFFYIPLGAIKLPREQQIEDYDQLVSNLIKYRKQFILSAITHLTTKKQPIDLKRYQIRLDCIATQLLSGAVVLDDFDWVDKLPAISAGHAEANKTFIENLKKNHILDEPNDDGGYLLNSWKISQ